MPPLEIPKPNFDQELKKDIETARQILISRSWANVFSDLWVNPNSVAEVKINSRKPNTSAFYLAVKTPAGIRLIALTETQTADGLVYTDPAKPNKTWRSVEKFLREEHPSFICLATYRIRPNRSNPTNQFRSLSYELPNVPYQHIALKKLEHYYNSALSAILSNNEFIDQNPTFPKFLTIIRANYLIPQILAEHSRDERDLPYLYTWLVDEISHFTKAKSEHNARGIVQLTEQAFKDLKRNFPSIFRSLTYNKVVADPTLSVMAMVLSLYSGYKLLSTNRSNFLILKSDDQTREFLFASYNRGIFAFGSTDRSGRYTLDKAWKSFAQNKADETSRYLDKIRRFRSLLS